MRAWLKQIAIPALTTILLVIISFGFTIWAARAGMFRPLEFWAYDRWIQQRPCADPSASPCVIIRVTDDDITSRWKQYPISDRVMAALLEKLLDAGPATIG